MTPDPSVHLHVPVVVVVIVVIAGVGAVLLVTGLARMAWRFLRDDEEIEAGGSWGKQIGRHH